MPMRLHDVFDVFDVFDFFDFISSRPTDRQISQMQSLMLLFYVSLTPLVLLVNASGCFYSANNSIWDSPSWVSPCGQITVNAPIVNCCDVSSNNICLSSHLCYNPNDPETFYLSPCTDPQYESAICPRYCQNRSDANQLNVVWSKNDQLWRCCASDDCTQVTDETFEAPAPANLTINWPPSTSTGTEFLISGAIQTSSNEGAPIQTSSNEGAPIQTSSNEGATTQTSSNESATQISSNKGTTTSLTFTSSSIPVNLSGASLTKSASSPATSTSSSQTTGQVGRGLSVDGIVGLAVGILGTVATIIGTWFAWKTYKIKKQKLHQARAP
ncbi:MAG: hypothetical protein MMC33_000814 [Icmadophila ericetorum]|nr:hypothetical protein [Icmadophila ericetorum]